MVIASGVTHKSLMIRLDHIALSVTTLGQSGKILHILKNIVILVVKEIKVACYILYVVRAFKNHSDINNQCQMLV